MYYKASGGNLNNEIPTQRTSQQAQMLHQNSNFPPIYTRYRIEQGRRFPVPRVLPPYQQQENENHFQVPTRHWDPRRL
jgi:hypothetical protein